MRVKTTTLLTSLTLMLASQSALVYAEPQGRRGPPPEAYTACENKNAGDTSQFKSPRGDTVSGTCEDQNGTLVLRPDRGGRGPRSDNQQGNGERPDPSSDNQQGNGDREGNRDRRGPPPEAYTACEGKSAGDTSQLKDRRGETLTGTCEEDRGKLVLRPDRPRR
ncbi:hypothetical protein [Candidatus Venteria ishoeyi]|uniref:Uncharacterized protein n=1 Tax=Candidatus Venteria ishoeyi TaxID=1899563 RepID=A0A1H6FBI6_9GAMM|nr:hypothetical protein [Candidatus Venteria ishoeyi]SEH07003.1 Uncharacterised protein [Candidatus Venteria ishoeyi]